MHTGSHGGAVLGGRGRVIIIIDIVIITLVIIITIVIIIVIITNIFIVIIIFILIKHHYHLPTLPPLTEIQGCLSASAAVMRLAGLMVSILLIRSLASGVTVSHSGEGN